MALECSNPHCGDIGTDDGWEQPDDPDRHYEAKVEKVDQ